MGVKRTSGKPEGVREGLKKATTEMLILFLLKQKPMYTYEMMTTIENLSKGVIQFNTLYLAIYRLQDFGYIEESEKVLSDENRVRVYFRITESGKKYFHDSEAEYRATTAVINGILSSEGSINGETNNGK